jgi:hypothetical protein
MMCTRKKIEQVLREQEVKYHFLQTDDGGWAIVVPEPGAKVLAAGVDGESAFWINPSLAKDGWCVGGQRTWLAPELGSEGFFGTGVEDWKVPPVLDPGCYRQIEGKAGTLTFRNDLTIERKDGRSFDLGIVRSIHIESPREAHSAPGLKIRSSYLTANHGLCHHYHETE